MSSLTPREKRQLEDLFDMAGGYVLDFSNPTFARFFEEELDIEIYDEAYAAFGGSKANRLRSFWARESDHKVAKALQALLDHCRDTAHRAVDRQDLFSKCEAIANRLAQGHAVPDIEAIKGDTEDFELVAKAARDAIDKNEPEQGLDRLHTFLVKFLRRLCEEHGIPRERSVPLGGLMGAYVKRLKAEGLLTSKMAEHILNSATAVLGQFDHVRNNHSLAHDNPVLSHDEALLIYTNVASAVKFIKSAEASWKQKRLRASAAPPTDIEIPF